MNAVANATPDQSLQLPSLVIKNFRGIDELTIPRLGRVTLLAGKNGVGKTTVLDAVRIWAARGNDTVISEVLINRGDFFTENRKDYGSATVGYVPPPGHVSVTEGGEKRTNLVADSSAVFTNRQLWPKVDISIGPINDGNTLQLSHRLADQIRATSGYFALEVKFGNSLHSPPARPVICNNIGPDRPTGEMIERYWNGIALTVHEDRAVEALNVATDGVIERIGLVDSTAQIGQPYRRRFMAKVASKDYPVPIRSLGDGAFRSFALALALANSNNGFLLIDEAENGIHHSIQPKFWKMVLQTAQRNNVQVLATTHSWDCVTGFAQAANELDDVTGMLVRIERPPAGLRAITYDEARLENISKYGIEVR